MTGRVVAFDPGYEEFYEGRAFIVDPRRYPGVRMWRLMKDRLLAHGFEVLTSDRVESTTGRLDEVLLISHGFGPASKRLVARGARPAVVFNWESPTVAWDFYHRLPEISRAYSTAFLFPGAVLRAAPTRAAEPMFLPQPRQLPVSEPNWTSRAYLTIVNSTATMESVSIVQLFKAIAQRIGHRRNRMSIRRQLVCLSDPALGRELYTERIRAIVFFSQSSDFALFGRGWDQYRGDPKVRRAVDRAYRGAPQDKLAALARFRFAIAFENASFPGYITDRIVDCFLAATIPVYRGAPDIKQYVPEDAFVDARRFGSYEQLDSHLRGMSEAEAHHRLAAARSFVDSPQFDLFDEQVSAKRIATAVIDAAS